MAKQQSSGNYKPAGRTLRSWFQNLGRVEYQRPKSTPQTKAPENLPDTLTWPEKKKDYKIPKTPKHSGYGWGP